jgi:hypothetical protein
LSCEWTPADGDEFVGQICSFVDREIEHGRLLGWGRAEHDSGHPPRERPEQSEPPNTGDVCSLRELMGTALQPSLAQQRH